MPAHRLFGDIVEADATDYHPPARFDAVLLDAYGNHPERFVRKIPTPPALPAVAWINKPEEEVPTH